MDLITEEGVYDLTDFQYHSDPVAVPSLSSSICKVLYEKTARHAWHAHPRLNPEFVVEHKKMFDAGSVAHALLLGEHEKIEVINHDSFRTNDAKAARDRAYNADRIPILALEFLEAKTMAEAASAQIEISPQIRGAFTKGKPERTLVWKEQGDIWCRAKVDWMPDDPENPDALWPDYKSTGSGAGPNEWGRRMLFDNGYDIQKAFYSRGIRKLFKVERPKFLFVVQENEKPWALAAHDLQPSALELAERKVEHALQMWRWSMQRGIWPGYAGLIHYNDSPTWHEAKLEDTEMHRNVLEQQGQDMFGLGINWRAS